MLAIVGCASFPSPPAPEGVGTEPVPLLSPRDLVLALQGGDNIVFLDVREPEEFAAGHIPGAINIPQRHLAERFDEIDPAALVIPYCNMDFRGFYAVRELGKLGLRSIALMEERGIYGWEGLGLPIASGADGLTDAQATRALAAIDARTLPSRRDQPRTPPTGRTRHIRVTASNWFFDPNDLEVDAGDEIHLIVESHQGDHFFVQPDYEVAMHVVEGRRQEVRFLADRGGDFRFGSCEWDGTDLQVMKGRLRVREDK